MRRFSCDEDRRSHSRMSSRCDSRVPACPRPRHAGEADGLGGQYEGKLPTGLRIASGVAGAVIYPLATLLILEAAEVTDFEVVPDVGPIGMWVFAGLFALGPS